MSLLLLLAPFGWALAFASCSQEPASAGRESLADQLAAARAAHGSERFAASGRELWLEGTALDTGLDGPWQRRVAADERYAARHDSRFPTARGSDGKSCWQVDPSGLVTTAELESRDFVRLEQAFWSGQWCASANGPLVIEARADGALAVRVRDGRLEGRLELDPASRLPRRLEVSTFHGERSYEFADWRTVEGGPAVAWRTRIDDDGQMSRFELTGASLVAPDPTAFARPTGSPTDATIDLTQPKALACKRAANGLLLVRATLDGVDHGRFIFDSGAGGLVLDPDVAQALGLEQYGELWIGGAGAARTRSGWYQARELTVGPVTIARPRFSGLELDALSQSCGDPLAGILGYDFFARVVATVDMKATTVEVDDPAAYQRDGVTWRALTLYSRHPHVECRLGIPSEERALFRIDTGAAGCAVLFHSPYVQEAALLDGRPTALLEGVSGIGGESAARIGTIDWFELGGTVHDRPTVIFIGDRKGALADPYSAGTIGSDLIAQQLLILDYPHGRLGFAPRP